MDKNYESTAKYNDMMNREDQQVKIDEWVNAHWDDYKDDFAADWFDIDREVSYLVTASRDEAKAHLAMLRSDFADDYEEYLEAQAKEFYGWS